MANIKEESIEDPEDNEEQNEYYCVDDVEKKISKMTRSTMSNSILIG